MPDSSLSRPELSPEQPVSEASASARLEPSEASRVRRSEMASFMVGRDRHAKRPRFATQTALRNARRARLGQGTVTLAPRSMMKYRTLPRTDLQLSAIG